MELASARTVLRRLYLDAAAVARARRQEPEKSAEVEAAEVEAAERRVMDQDQEARPKE
jgi:hypothetical protein